MALSFADGRGPLPDSWRELRFLVALLAVAVFLVFTGTLFYVQEHPGAPWQLEAAYSSALSFAGDDQVTADATLRLPQEDAEYLNRIYRELDGYSETGYCVHLVDGEIRVSKAATRVATESMVRFTTANCQFVDATIHTHPPWSQPVLSGPDTSISEEFNDKQSLLSSGHQFSCVQAGRMTTDAGERTRAFRCYRPPGSGDVNDVFPEMSVVID